MADDEVSFKYFGASFKTFLDKVSAQAPDEEPPLCRLLREHFGRDPAPLPIVTEDFAKSEHANFQLALDDYLGASGRDSSFHGIAGGHDFVSFKLSHLVIKKGGNPFGPPLGEGPVEYTNVGVGDERVLSCIQSGLLLIRDGESRHAMLVQGARKNDWRARLTLEVMSDEPEKAQRLLADLRSGM